jgi:CBS domain containing-hemolysin-like protein
LYDVLDVFQSGKSHLAIVSNNAEKLFHAISVDISPTSDCAPVGIITIEDIFEEILQVHIELLQLCQCAALRHV